MEITDIVDLFNATCNRNQQFISNNDKTLSKLLSHVMIQQGLDNIPLPDMYEEFVEIFTDHHHNLRCDQYISGMIGELAENSLWLQCVFEQQKEMTMEELIDYITQ